jgi:hypothetical protein
MPDMLILRPTSLALGVCLPVESRGFWGSPGAIGSRCHWHQGTACRKTSWSDVNQAHPSYLSTYRPIYIPTYLSNQCINQSIDQSNNLSINQCINLTIKSIYQSIDQPRQSFVQDYVVHGLFVLDFSCTWRNKILAKILDFSRYTFWFLMAMLRPESIFS